MRATGQQTSSDAGEEVTITQDEFRILPRAHLKIASVTDCPPKFPTADCVWLMGALGGTALQVTTDLTQELARETNTINLYHGISVDAILLPQPLLRRQMAVASIQRARCSSRLSTCPLCSSASAPGHSDFLALLQDERRAIPLYLGQCMAYDEMTDRVPKSLRVFA
eukprot:CAMPEP_0195574598 /NCGR_PEP_ID=MMETSP0814-20130614/6054_1 /TAXON_ID=97485 /ORGANISM="Prymnesium parvum, Strain Texoma1" /LENGTH=166 /DNA_ID=CAMNT_0040710619 /DNA_START=626 /DNA_END=1122 /DNA_ORIENTATION=+